MAGSSRTPLFAAALLAWSAASGCTTGHLLQAGRYHEQVVRYEAAYAGDDRLLLEYVVERGDRSGSLRGFAHREVALRLEDLRAEPEIVVDEFPVETLRIREALRAGDDRLELIPPDAPVVPSSRYLAIELEAGRPVGFRLMGGEDAVAARFHSGALYRRHYEWWIYPLLPLTTAVDLVLLLPQIVTATPLFVVNE